MSRADSRTPMAPKGPNDTLTPPESPPQETPEPLETEADMDLIAYVGLLILGSLGAILVGCIYVLFRVLKKKRRSRRDRRR